MISEKVAIVVMFVTFVSAVVLMVRSILEHIRRSRLDRHQAELYAKIIDRCSSAPELLAYLQSEAGQSLMRAAPPVERPAAYSRILNSLQFGLAFCLLGGAFLFLRAMIGGDFSEPGLVLGFLLLAGGLALIGGGVTSYVLSRHFGLLEGLGPAAKQGDAGFRGSM